MPCLASLDKAPRLSISIIFWILSSDTICQFNQFHTNSEATMLSRQVATKREADGSKHGSPGHRGQGIVLGSLERTLKCSRSGRRRLGRWSLGATEERRSGWEFWGNVCESESCFRYVILYLSS